MVTYNVDDLHEINKKANERKNQLSIKLYFCSVEGCAHNPFKYELKVHNYDRHAISKPALLTIHLLLRDVNDCIREGNGERLLECYKVALLYFKCYGHTKYAYTILKLLFRIKIQPHSAFQLIWGRFINTSGKKGRNISQDLHLEHLNRFLKDLLTPLLSNLNEPNADRIAKSIQNLKFIVENTERSLLCENTLGWRKTVNTQEDVKKLAVEYHKAGVFKEQNGREYEPFPSFKQDLLSKIDLTKLTNWIKLKKEEFICLYTD